MILLTYEEKNYKTKVTKRRIAEMFDTAKEFKEYVIECLIKIEKDFKVDEPDFEMFPKQRIEESSFEKQFEQFLIFNPDYEVRINTEESIAL